MGYARVYDESVTYTATDDLIGEIANQHGGNLALTYTKYYAFQVTKDVFPISSFRWKISVKSHETTVYVHLYKNGVSVGSEFSDALEDDVWHDYGADQSFTDLKRNDTIELWAYSSADKPSDAIKDFRLYGAASPFYKLVV